ncbi:MAG: EamA family transporter [Hyphomicrobiales bacterium]|nr:EamA family transporter [Hyphomicrobiales bacterium]MBV9520982.1 EamA family transporter [Hyphomicrobiales bacterium]
MMQMPFKARMLAAFAAVYLIWGSTYLAIALGIESIPPFLLMGLRSVIGGGVLFAWSRWGPLDADGGGLKREDPPGPRAWAHAAICGLLFFLGCHGILAYAEKQVPSGIAAIVLATIPFWIVLLNSVLPGARRPPGLTLLALVPGFAGVALIAWREASRPEHPLDPVMILLLLASAFSWALGSVVSQRHASLLSAATLSGMQLLCGGAALLACSLLAGELVGFSPSEVSARSFAGLAYLALAGTVLGFASYIWLLDRAPAPLVSTYTFVNPIIAVLLGWLILSEPMAPEMLIGAALVVASVIAVGLFDASHRHEVSAGPPANLTART